MKKSVDTKVNRQYEDRLFKFIFSDKADLLELYNAINDTNYSNPDDMEINTLQGVVYMGMYNDISFLIADVLNLYEHQSTFSPNLPLRGFIYFADLYRKILGNWKDVYSSKLITLPTPKFVIFYNGEKEEPERRELRLSDAFQSGGKACIECVATMININAGHNEKIMKRCKKLREYARFLELVRENISEGMLLEDAVDFAVEQSINEDVLRDILITHQAEVKNMLLTEYNEELHIENERRIAKEEGEVLGEAKLSNLVAILLKEGKLEELQRVSEDSAYRAKMYEQYHITD